MPIIPHIFCPYLLKAYSSGIARYLLAQHGVKNFVLAPAIQASGIAM